MLQSSRTDCVALLTHALNCGVTSFHSSTEYDSFELFCDALAQASYDAGVNMKELRHIVKLAEPSFNETTFSEEQLLQAIDHYCERLQTDQLDVVQWMLRGDLKDSTARVMALEGASEQIGKTVNTLKKRNQIRKFGCFPYSDDFRTRVMQYAWCDALVDYVNPLEQSARLAAEQLRDDQSLIAIRPLFPLTNADPLIRNQWTIKQLVCFATASPKLDGIIASTSSIDHLNTLLALISDTEQKTVQPS